MGGGTVTLAEFEDTTPLTPVGYSTYWGERILGYRDPGCLSRSFVRKSDPRTHISHLASHPGEGGGVLSTILDRCVPRCSNPDPIEK